MYKFNNKLYTDVRIENIFSTSISFTKENLDNAKDTEYKAAFIRVFDGNKWYYSSITNINNIQNEIDKLSKMATENSNINENEIVEKYEINNDINIKYDKENIKNISKQDKIELVKTYFSSLKNENILMYSSYYNDKYIIKEFYSSKGANIKYDNQICGITFSFNINIDNFIKY